MVKDRCRGFMDVGELVSLASVYAKPRSRTEYLLFDVACTFFQ